MSDLIERLRDAATKPNGWAILGADVATRAADEIERLERELAEARAGWVEQTQELGRQLDKLAEAHGSGEKLREAIDQLIDGCRDE